MSICHFCEIVTEEKPATLIFEDNQFLVILDIRPVFKGHCLVLPKKHYLNIETLPNELIGPTFSLVKKTANALENALAADGVFIALNHKVSQSVPHLHVHVIPRRFKDGLKGFFWPRMTYQDAEEIREYQEKISAEMK